MVGITAVDRAGVAHELQTELGAPLMEVLRDNGLLEGACGGNCACATCHILLDEGWYAKLPPPDRFEIDLLSAGEHYVPGVSRLSCQISASETLEGMRFIVAEED